MKARLATVMLVFAAVCGSAYGAQDTLRQALEESKNSGKGLTFLVNGQPIAGVVVSVDEHYIVARSQAQGAIVIRLDKLDGVAGFISLGVSDKKAQ